LAEDPDCANGDPLAAVGAAPNALVSANGDPPLGAGGAAAPNGLAGLAAAAAPAAGAAAPKGLAGLAPVAGAAAPKGLAGLAGAAAVAGMSNGLPAGMSNGLATGFVLLLLSFSNGSRIFLPVSLPAPKPDGRGLGDCWRSSRWWWWRRLVFVRRGKRTRKRWGWVL
jgi:hypothetical protein